MYAFISVLLLIHATNSALLLWTPKPLFLPILKPFTNKDFAKLMNDLDNPPVVAFKASSLQSALKLKNELNSNNTVYLLNHEMDISEDVNVLELTEETSIDSNVANENALVVLVIDEALSRTKRKFDNDTAANEEIVEEPFIPESEPLITGAVLYTYAIDKKEEVMMYSSKPLLLSIDDATIYLGNASMTFMDVRGSYTRFIVRIATVNNRSIFLRFIFSTSSGYWFLNFVEVEVNSVKYNLALISGNVTAPNHMSYHCEDETLFADVKSNISLYLYDLQVQPDAHNYKFSDAFNCIPFTTAPILSGLFVTAIMCIGLAIGLMALSSIKTMDRFDNSKTKQLSITLFE